MHNYYNHIYFLFKITYKLGKTFSGGAKYLFYLFAKSNYIILLIKKKASSIIPNLRLILAQ